MPNPDVRSVTTKFRPTLNHLLVDPDAQPDVSAGGIVLAKNFQTPSGSGIVLAVGPTVQTVKAGEKVAFVWLNGRTVDWNGKQYKVFREDELIGVFEPVSADAAQ